jgi:hypothetical protein
MKDRVRFGSVLGYYLSKLASESKIPIPEKASNSISYDLTVILGQFYTRTNEQEALELLRQNYRKVQQYFNMRIKLDGTIIELAGETVKSPLYSEAKQKVDDFIKNEALPIEVKAAVSESLISLERRLDPNQSRKIRTRVEELQNEIKVINKLTEQIKPKAP